MWVKLNEEDRGQRSPSAQLTDAELPVMALLEEFDASLLTAQPSAPGGGEGVATLMPSGCFQRIMEWVCDKGSRSDAGTQM